MKGLTSAQVSQSLTKYGLNIITEQRKKSILIKFFEQSVTEGVFLQLL